MQLFGRPRRQQNPFYIARPGGWDGAQSQPALLLTLGMRFEFNIETLKHQVVQAMKNIVFAMMALMLAPSFAMAGESNSKDDPVLKVRNRSNLTALVVIDDFEGLEDADSLEDFQADGGIVLGPGDTSEGLEVKAGNHEVFWFYVIDEELPESDLDFEAQTVKVREGRDRTFTLPAPYFPLNN